MKLLAAVACWLGVMSAACAQGNTPAPPDTVVLLHGLGRTRFSMLRLAQTLEREGYRVVNLSYPSRTMPLETLARDWLPAHLAAAGATIDRPGKRAVAAPRLHIVTHSMGGIVLRLWLRDHPAPPNLGRVVMLAPPNRGSEVSDRLTRFPPFRWFTGANGRRLGTTSDALPATLGPWPVPNGLGIVAGDCSLNPLFSAWLPGADDGKVTVAATDLAGASDHLVLHHSHTWIAWRRDTATHVAAFLRTGTFARRPA